MAVKSIVLIRGRERRTLPNEPQINVLPAINRLRAQGFVLEDELRFKAPPITKPFCKSMGAMRRRPRHDAVQRLAQQLGRREHERMLASAKEWAACSDVLAGESAFILGNGPTLPSSLIALDHFFTVGVNRIAFRYDPTVLMWFDPDVWEDIQEHVERGRAICFFIPENRIPGITNDLLPHGTTHHFADYPLTRPDYITATGNGGVAAAYWAMSLGCWPVFLLGMSCEYIGKRTNFYGRNRTHDNVTLTKLRRAHIKLLRHKGVFQINSEDEMNAAARYMESRVRTRQWFHDTLRARHAEAASMLLPKMQSIRESRGMGLPKPPGRMATLSALAGG